MENSKVFFNSIKKNLFLYFIALIIKSIFSGPLLMRATILTFIIVFTFTFAAFTQSNRPSVIFQTGFRNDVLTFFRFSTNNTYLYAYNEAGEYLLWDLHTNKQIKRTPSQPHNIPEMYYDANPEFSKNERYILIPDFPKGNYILYDIVEDSILHNFIPPHSENGETYTHARFSADGSRILLLAQYPDNDHYSSLNLYTNTGELIKQCHVDIPRFDGTVTTLYKLLNGKKRNELLNKSASIIGMDVSPTLDEVYLLSSRGRVFKLNFGSKSHDAKFNESEFDRMLDLPGKPMITNLKVLGDKVVIQSFRQIKKLKDDRFVYTDSIYVINGYDLQISKKVVSKFIIDRAEKSNSVTTSPIFSNSAMDIYFDSRENEKGKEVVVFKDILTDKELISFERGQSFKWFTKGEYQSSELNGGFLVAVSDDHKMMAVCSRDLILTNLETNKITAYFPLIRGSLKLNQPVFIDSTRILIPKIYTDAFIIDLKHATVDRLKREIDCQDTVRYGANSYFQVDGTSGVIGMQNATVSRSDNRIAIASHIPIDLCITDDKNKRIEVWSADHLEHLNTFSFHDPEYTYFLNLIPGDSSKFLVNYKLVDFDEKGNSSVKDLKVVQKKDTFYALNPVFLPSKNSIFSVLATRTKPGNPDLIFAYFSLEGKMLSSYRYERRKSKEQFQTFLSESQLSPDSSRLLFCFHDGIAGIFDIDSMKVTKLVEHGEGLNYKFVKSSVHTWILAGCFIDKDYFVTCGNDAMINIWSMNSDKPERSIAISDNANLYGVCVSPDKRFLVGSDVDKKIVFINLKTGITDLTFQAFNFERYALITKDGYYIAHKRSSNDLAFRYQGRFYEFSQFDIALNRPDKILEEMKYASEEETNYFRKAYTKRIQKLGYNPLDINNLRNYAAPEVHLSNLPQEATTTATEILFTVTATRGKDPLDRLSITVNGVPQYGSKGLLIKPDAGNSVTIPVKFPLSFGQNQITVSVINKRGVESLREYIAINRKEQTLKPNLFIVSIGAGTFLDKSKNLIYASKDAVDVSNLFDQKSTKYGKINKLVLTNEKVTRQSIISIKDQLKKSQPDDLVILYYAGHGILDDKLNYYLSTYSTDFTKPALQALAYDELENLLDSIPARNKVLLIDACHSGELDKENIDQYYSSKTTVEEKVFRNASKRSYKEKTIGLANSFELMQTLFSDLRRSSGCTVIASAGGAEYAVESDRWKNGVFTYCLQIGLKEKLADLNKDGIIQLSELGEFLRFKVSDLTNGSQQPTSRTENIVNDIVIW